MIAMNIETIFITGGTGFFGKSMLDFLNKNYHNFNIYVLTRNSKKFIDENQHRINLVNVKFVDGDVKTFDFSHHIDYFIHAATPVIEKTSDKQMSSIVEDGTQRALDVAEKNGCRRFLFISSGAVYGKNDHPMKESDECHPITQYGISKLNAEKMCIKSNLDTCIARCFAFSGRFLSKTSQFAIGNFVKDAVDNKPICINSDGKSIRSYLDQDDLCRWLMSILLHSSPNKTYNVGSNQAISIFELAMLIRKLLNPNIKIILNKSIQNSNTYIPDTSKIMNNCRCKIEKSLEQSILEMARTI